MKININKQAVGSRIKQIRANKGCTQESFGKLLNASKSNVQKWESGFTLPNKERIANICKISDITVNELLYGSVLEFAKENFENILFLLGGSENINGLKKAVNKDMYLKYIQESEKYTNLSLNDTNILLDELWDLCNDYILNSKNYIIDKNDKEYLISENISVIVTGFNALCELSKSKDFLEKITEDEKEKVNKSILQLESIINLILENNIESNIISD